MQINEKKGKKIYLLTIYSLNHGNIFKASSFFPFEVTKQNFAETFQNNPIF